MYFSCSSMSNSLGSHGLYPASFLCPWDFPSKSTGVGCHAPLQGITRPRDWTHISCVSSIAGRFFTSEPLGKPNKLYFNVSSVQSLSHVQLCDPMDCSTPGLPPSPSPGVHSNSCPLSQWCHPTISSSVISFSSLLQSSIRIFSNESVLCIRWPEYWSFSFSISPSNEHSGLISFRTDWLDLFAV